MRKSKRVCLMLAFCLVFAFIAGSCSSGGGDGGTTTKATTVQNNTQDGGTQANATTAPATPKKGLQLSFWTWKSSYVPGFKAAADGFEKKTGIKVTVQAFPGDDAYKAKVAAAANAGNVADVINYWTTIAEIENGFFELSNSGLIDKEWRSRFLPQAFNLITVKQSQYDAWQREATVAQVKKDMKLGDCFGVPLEVGGFFTFYGNKKLVEKAGLKAEAPKTWEDFVAMMKTVKEKTGAAGLVMGEGSPDLWYNWCGTALEIMLNGGEGYSALMQRTEKMNNPKHLPVIQALETVIKEGLLLPGCNVMSIDKADQAFGNDMAAFDLGGSFTLASLAMMGKNPDDYFTFLVPPIKGSKYTEWKETPAAMTDLMISKNTKDKDAALDFCKYITSSEGALLFANKAFCIPAINLGDDRSKLLPALDRIMSKYATDGSLFDNVPEYPQGFWDNAEWRMHDARIQRMIAGNYTAEMVAKDFDTRMDEMLAARQAQPTQQATGN